MNAPKLEIGTMVEILCTLTGVISGIAIVAALMQQQGARRRTESAAPLPSLDETESLKGLANQLQLLTHCVAADVSAHAQRVVNINQRLLPGKNEPERFLSAINDLIQANESMQGQLAAAQQRLNKQSEQIEATAQQARTDALTGLPNRRALEETLKKCIDSAGGTHTTGLMLIDIDFFKRFNDTYGHMTGDAVLASFASNISKWCNGKFHAARYGGEEFAIILTGDCCSTLARLAAEARAYLSQEVIHHEDLRLSVTASAGLTILQAGDTMQRVYERADEGLYQSKKAGRNCGHWSRSGESKPFHTASALAVEPGQPANDESATIIARTHTNEIKEQRATPVANTSQIAEPHRLNVDASTVLDLSTFVDRLDTQLKQLGRADMPATAIMLEAVGLTFDSVPDFDRSWVAVLAIVQSNLRGIDLICRLRKNTLCVFMPGCTLSVALERAGGMQHMLQVHQSSSPSEHYPARLAVAVACAKPNELSGVFLQRLEEALEEAQDAGPRELVVCEGNSSYFVAS